MKAIEQEPRGLKRVEETLRPTAHVIGGRDQPPDQVAEFAEASRKDVVEGGRLRVELICTALQVAFSTYYIRESRLPSVRQVRFAVVGPTLMELRETDYRDYRDYRAYRAYEIIVRSRALAGDEIT